MSLKKFGREALRKEAKKIYKEQTKNIPRRNRIPFSQFFKEFLKMRKNKSDVITAEPEVEDFNFDDFVNINEITDEDMEAVEEE